ncbi:MULTISPECIES: 6-phospho-3-hexuloisomerase [unclassified Clostridium]|uniref:6-phospho-3-hexuloisomerase n=1 Tax=unclassified Clostridium TaxID=2614128 RepID=UPI00189817C6|nr:MULTISPECIES: 6-phospho-3-hexuloisomerase [unclassified Clostridium]MCR1951105.1 6-phospho-3-hexuloisomerase [Clostridium sp. DSM 100503]
MNIREEILEEVNNVVLNVNEKDIEKMVNTIDKNYSIFVDGEGRSGFQAKGFAMRLMHIGYKSYVMGETITPALKKDDIYIAISGSGTTKNTLSNAKSAKDLGLKVIAVTSKKKSPLGEIADIILEVPGKVKGDGEGGSIQLLSSLFDQAVHIVLDLVCLLTSKRDNFSNKEALNNHINVE